LKTENNLATVHPAGEDALEDFTFQFDPGGGRMHLVGCQDNLSAYGGLVAWDHFLERTGLLERLAESCPVERTSPNATPVRDILRAFILNCLVGGQRFAHVRRLQDDPVIAQLTGVKKGHLCGEDAFRRLCQALDPAQGRRWMAHGEEMLYHALPANAIADWDSTVTTRYGRQEDVAVGYNPRKPGRGSHHPLVCAVAGTRLALHMRWRAGNTVSASQWEEAMEEVWSHPVARARLKLNRGDIGFGQEKVMAWHEAEAGRPDYLFKLKLSSGVRRAVARIDPSRWQPASSPIPGVEQIAETEIQLHGWSRKRRAVVVRTVKPAVPGAQEEFWSLSEERVEVYVTNLSAEEVPGAHVVLLYRQRADAENVFDELKNQWGFAGFCSRQAVVSECAARLLLMVYNLWALSARVTGGGGRHLEAVTSRYELLLVPARLVISGRQKRVKLAVSGKFAERLRAAYQRLQRWLSSIAPQLSLSGYRLPNWTLYSPPELAGST